MINIMPPTWLHLAFPQQSIESPSWFRLHISNLWPTAHAPPFCDPSHTGPLAVPQLSHSSHPLYFHILRTFYSWRKKTQTIHLAPLYPSESSLFLKYHLWPLLQSLQFLHLSSWVWVGFSSCSISVVSFVHSSTLEESYLSVSLPHIHIRNRPWTPGGYELSGIFISLVPPSITWPLVAAKLVYILP